MQVNVNERKVLKLVLSLLKAQKHLPVENKVYLFEALAKVGKDNPELRMAATGLSDRLMQQLSPFHSVTEYAASKIGIARVYNDPLYEEKQAEVEKAWVRSVLKVA
jgi:hypothetical protein